MPSASWLNGWLAGDVVTAAEFRKGVGAVYDTLLGAASALIDTGAVLPTTYAHMRIVAYLRGDSAGSGGSSGGLLRFNADSAANYQYELLRGTGAAASASANAAQTALPLDYPLASDTALRFSVAIIDIPNYGNTTNHKTVVELMGMSMATQFADYVFGVWAGTAAINRVSLAPAAGNFVVGSRVTIYVWGS